MNDRVSLVKKVLNKGIVLTPYEAIKLRYLSEQGLLEELVNVERTKNPYISAQRAKGPVSPFMVNYIIGKSRENDPDLFISYERAYERLSNGDKQSERLGYKGLMLVSELRMMRAEYSFLATHTKPKTDLLNFRAYSYFHQSEASFTEVLSSLGETFRYFIKDIDNILTLNYYLDELIKTEDLLCVKLLKMWLGKPKTNDANFDNLNGAYLCCTKENLEQLIDENHPAFVEGISWKLNDLPASFAETSKQYVWNIIEAVAVEASYKL